MLVRLAHYSDKKAGEGCVQSVITGLEVTGKEGFKYFGKTGGCESSDPNERNCDVILLLGKEFITLLT